MSLTKKEFFRLIDNEVKDYLKKKNKQKKKDTEIKLENDSEQEDLFPGMKQFKKLGRGVLQEDGKEISREEWEALKARVKGIFRGMPVDQRRAELAEMVEEFGLLYFNQFLKLQDRMIDSSKGKLDEPGKKQAG